MPTLNCTALLKNIKTIIFDLGGVIVDLDVSRTIHGFAKLSGFSSDKVKNLYTTHPVFHDYEKGLVTDAMFRSEVRSLFESNDVDDVQLDAAWNAMLLRIPKDKLDLLTRLKEKYQVMILSNTNNIHVEEMNNRLLPEAAGVSSFDSVVHKAYYSHQLKMRKPDAEIYQFVLDDYKLKSNETVFLDDNVDNIQGALKLGIQVKHITNPSQVFALFD